MKSVDQPKFDLGPSSAEDHIGMNIVEVKQEKKYANPLFMLGINEKMHALILLLHSFKRDN